MALLSENTSFGTRVEAIAPRIAIDWNPYTNDGPVTFHFERLTTQADGTVLERTFLESCRPRSATCWPTRTPLPTR